MILLQSHKLIFEYKKICLQNILNHLIKFLLLSTIYRKTNALPFPTSYYETDNFTTLLLHNDLFVDKSLLIQEFLEHENSPFASTVVRPKGWGKSTNIHMLEKFFEIEVDENGLPLPKEKTINDKLFLGGTIDLSPTESKTLKPLKIAKFPNITERLGKHPVIVLRLENATGQNYDELERRIKLCVVEVFKRHEYLTRSTNITQKEVFEKYLKGDLNTDELRGSLHFLALKLKEHFDREVFLLVDDYDVPLISAYREFERGDGWKEFAKAVELLRYILSAARKRSVDIPTDFISTTEKTASSTDEASNSNNTSNITPDLSKNTTDLSNITSDSPTNSTLQINTPNATSSSSQNTTNASNITPDPTTITIQDTTSTTSEPTTEVDDSDISAIPPLEERNTALLTGLLDLLFENPKTQIFLEFSTVYTLFDDPFAMHFGFTHEEVQDLLTKISTPADLDQLKLWYNGYNYKFRHQKQPQFYNPRSVMRCLLASKVTYGYYGDEDDIDKEGIIYEILSTDEMQEDIQLLITSASQWIGGYNYMCSPVRWERSIPDVLSDKRTLLIFHGLLGPCRPDPFHNGPNIGIPNKEAKCVYETNMMRWVCKKFATNANELHSFVGLLCTGDINSFGRQLQIYLLRASEFIKSSEYNAKIAYGGLMMAIKTILVQTGQQAIDVKENRAIRSINDMLLVPKPSMSRIAFAIQYKIIKERNLTEEVDEENLTEEAIGKNLTEEAIGKNLTEEAIGKNLTEETTGKNLTEEAIRTDLIEAAEAKLEEINELYCDGTVIEKSYPEVRKVFKLGIAFCGETVAIRYDISEPKKNDTPTEAQMGDYILRRKAWKNALISRKYQAAKHHRS